MVRAKSVWYSVLGLLLTGCSIVEGPASWSHDQPVPATQFAEDRKPVRVADRQSLQIAEEKKPQPASVPKPPPEAPKPAVSPSLAQAPNASTLPSLPEAPKAAPSPSPVEAAKATVPPARPETQRVAVLPRSSQATGVVDGPHDPPPPDSAPPPPIPEKRAVIIPAADPPSSRSVHETADRPAPARAEQRPLAVTSAKPSEPSPVPAPPSTRPSGPAIPPPDEPPPPKPQARGDTPALNPPTAAVDDLHRIHKQAADACAGIDSYLCRLTRREQVNGKVHPEEVILFKFRKQPFSVHFKWIGTEGKGREVVFVKGQYDSKLQILMAAGDSLFASAGTRMAFAPDNPLVRRSSRHPITEAGVCAIVEGFGASLAAADRGSRSMKYLGPVKRSEFDAGISLEAVEEELPPGADPNLPHGGHRQLFFDTANHLPTLLITRDERGQEVEYYRFDRLQYPVKLDGDDFNPDKLWAKPKR
jgi:hypothetical protein